MASDQLNVILLGASRRGQGHPGRTHRGALRAAAHLDRRDAARRGRAGHRDGTRGAALHAGRRARPGRGRDRRRARPSGRARHAARLPARRLSRARSSRPSASTACWPRRGVRSRTSCSSTSPRTSSSSASRGAARAASAASSTTSPSIRRAPRASATPAARRSLQRADDNEETVRNRLAVYRSQTAPADRLLLREGRPRRGSRRRQDARRRLRAGGRHPRRRVRP